MTVISDVIRYTRFSLIYAIYLLVGSIVRLVHIVTCPRQPTKYDVSCHVMKVLWKWKFVTVGVASPSNFISYHERFTSPEYVLRENVSLYCVTNDDAVFVEVPDTVDVYSSRVNAFLYIGQFEHAVRVIRMPLASLYKLVEELPAGDMDICYIANTGRCGSTLLGQVLEKVPNTLLLGEPDCLTNLGFMYRDNVLSGTQYEELLVAIIRVLCKPRSGICRICIKTRCCASLHITPLSVHFPNMKFIFSYRNSLKTISSFLGINDYETARKIAMYLINADWVSKRIPLLRNMMHFNFSYTLEREPFRFDRRNLNAVEQYTYAWCLCVTLVRDFMRQNNAILPVLYEDLVADKAGTLTEVFQYLSIDEHHVGAALIAFQEDSQKGTVLEKRNIDDKHRRTISDKDRRRANVIMATFGLPNIGDPFIL